MNPVGLLNRFLRHAHRLHENADFFQVLRHADDVFRFVHNVPGQETMPEINPPLEVSVVGRHVIRANLVVEAPTGAAHGQGYIISRFELSDIRPYGFDTPKTLVADDQIIVPGRGCAILGGVYLFVGAVHAHA